MFSTDRQLAALQTAVTDLGPLPELKTLVYFGSGLRLNGTDNLAQMRATVNAAVRANVTLNPIDTRGLVGDAADGRRDAGLARRHRHVQRARSRRRGITRGQQSQDTLYALAKDTGGRAMFDNNDLSLGIAQAAQAVTGYYILGYYTKNIAKDGTYRRVKVALAAGLVGGPVVSRRATTATRSSAKFNACRQGAPARGGAEARGSDHRDSDGDGGELLPDQQRRVLRAGLGAHAGQRAGATASRAGASQVEIDMIGEIKDEYGVTLSQRARPRPSSRWTRRRQRRRHRLDSVRDGIHAAARVST